VASYRIQLPDRLTLRHRHIIAIFLRDDLRQSDWSLATEAFGILGEALFITPERSLSFQRLYAEMVDEKYADNYLRELLTLDSVPAQSPGLWAKYAREITQLIKQQEWFNLFGGRTFLAYCLYWWSAFARGYAFEVEIFHDLEQSGILFEAHDLTIPADRFTPYDLLVSGLTGDIKTSLYFVQLARRFAVDFFVVRLHIKSKSVTVAVLLRPKAWDELNGDTVVGTWDSFARQWPQPVRIKQSGYDVVAIEYAEWKRRILRWQGEQE